MMAGTPVPTGGSQTGARRQQTWTAKLFPADPGSLTGAGDSVPIPVDGFNGAITGQIVKTGANSATFDVLGTLDEADEVDSNTVWVPVRILIIGVGGVLNPVAGAQNLAAGAATVTFAVLDSFATLKVTFADGDGGTYTVSGRMLVTPV